MVAAGRSTGQVATETVLSTTLVDAHAKPAVDAGSIPAASTSVKMTKPLLTRGLLAARRDRQHRDGSWPGGCFLHRWMPGPAEPQRMVRLLPSNALRDGHLSTKRSSHEIARRLKDNPMTDATTSWPDLAESLYERLTGRNAEIAYQFDDFELEVPSDTSPESPRARWKVNGRLRVTTTDGVDRDRQMAGSAR